MVPPNIEEHFGQVTDPRNDNARHPLLSIITITIMGVLCGADNWVEVEWFGKMKHGWLSTFLDLPHGIPSHDTFGRVFRQIAPEEFEAGFRSWTQAICDKVNGVIAIDGKSIRGSRDGVLGTKALHMVNVWAVDNQMTLAAERVDDKTNEVTVIPTLIKLFDLSEATVTIDAMGCQTAIAQAIMQAGGDYVLAVKDNQPTLLDDIMTCFEEPAGNRPGTYHRTVDKGHGRIEIRECWAIDAPAIVDHINDYKEWEGLRSVVKVTSERRINGASSLETRYFISSHPAHASDLLTMVRAHWQIENSLHWVLDMAFAEDASRVRKDFAAQNFAVLRRLTLNLLKQDTQYKAGINAKRKIASWNHEFLLSLFCSS